MTRWVMSSLKICVKRKKMYSSWKIMPESDLEHSLREVCKNLVKVPVGMSLVSVRLDKIMACTMSVAGENRGEGARRG